MVKKKNSKKETLKKALKNKKLMITASIILVFVVLVSTIIILYQSFNNPRVISINNIEYDRNDYMIYLRIAKNELFDEDTTDLPDATLNMIADKTTNITVEKLLKSKVEQSLKVAGAIETMAEKNNIYLDLEDIEKIESEKNKYISSLGGQKKFDKFLKNNRTTEEAYDNMAKVDALYKKIYNNLYAEGKKLDLSDSEKEDIKKEYYLTYYKAKQIVFYIVDQDTKDPLTNSVIEQKKLLAETVRTKITDINKFDDYIKRYSDDAIGIEPPYDMYFTTDKVLKEVGDTVSSIREGEVSNVVKSTYAYHIILKEKLDDGYLEELYNKKREEKFLKALSDTIDESVIIIEDDFTSTKIK